MQYKSLALAAALSGVAMAAPAGSDTTTAAYTDYTGTATASADWTNTNATPTPSSGPRPGSFAGIMDNEQGQCFFKFANALGCNGESSPFGVKNEKGECVGANDETSVGVPVCDGSVYYFFKDGQEMAKKGDAFLLNHDARAHFHFTHDLPGWTARQKGPVIPWVTDAPHHSATPTPSFSYSPTYSPSSSPSSSPQ